MFQSCKTQKQQKMARGFKFGIGKTNKPSMQQRTFTARLEILKAMLLLVHPISTFQPGHLGQAYN